MIEKSRVKYLVSKALDYQFEGYSWESMIDDIDDLTNEERKWAKEHLTYKVEEVK